MTKEPEITEPRSGNFLDFDIGISFVIRHSDFVGRNLLFTNLP